MHSLLCLTSLLIIVMISTCSCANEEYQYANCRHAFEYSGYLDLTYPFWGSNRPSYCGHPEFELKNSTGDGPLISIDSLDYTLLDLNHSQNTLVVARDDYWENPCPTELHNTTLDPSLFNLPSDSQNLTLYYDCSKSLTAPLSASNQFSCNMNDSEQFNYFVIEAVRTMVSTSGGVYAPNCKEMVILPISNSVDGNLTTNTSLVPALKAGFGLTWNLNSSSYCDKCIATGGYCG